PPPASDGPDRKAVGPQACLLHQGTSERSSPGPSRSRFYDAGDRVLAALSNLRHVPSRHQSGYHRRLPRGRNQTALFLVPTKVPPIGARPPEPMLYSASPALAGNRGNLRLAPCRPRLRIRG